MTHPTPAPGTAEKMLALLSVCLAAISMPLTFTAPAVALPAIARTLGGDPVALNWATNAFLLTFGSCVMAAGSLADSYGRKRVFLIGLVLFAAASLAAACAPDILWFDLARTAQGFGAAAAFSGGMASLAQEFDGAARLRAFSIVGTSFGIGLAFGPVAAALMIDRFGWPSSFYLVILLAALAFVCGVKSLRESRDPAATGLDWPGAMSFTIALSLFTFAILLAPDRGWSDAVVLVLFAGSVGLFAAFGAIEQRVRRPMLDLSLFRYPRFVGVQLLAAAPAYAYVVLLVLLPIRFIGIEGMSELAAGRMMIVLSSPLLVLPLAAGQLTRWLAPATICGAGLVLSAAGLLWLAQIPLGQTEMAVAPLLMIGTGISLPWGLMDGLAVSVVPRERAGMATGIFSTTRVAGEGVALAVVSAILSTLTASQLSAHAGTSSTGVVTAAQRLVTGDVAAAMAALPELGRAVVIKGYGDAFHTLLLILAGITMLTAVVVFLYLGKGGESEDSSTSDTAMPVSDPILCAEEAG